MRERLLGLLDTFPTRRIIVAGDLIVDEFLYGEISRVSREAPVLVLDYQEMIRVPGGAANAANNLLDLDCAVGIVGIVGEDEAGDELLSTLARKGADTRGIKVVGSYATAAKTRIVAGAPHSSRQQIVRVDRCRAPKSYSPDWAGIETLSRKADGLILSDYGYGAVTPPVPAGITNLARGEETPVIVDSRFRMTDYANVTSMTPNITELESAVGLKIGQDEKLLARTAGRVIHDQGLKHLLVTQGRFGMTLFQNAEDPVPIPIFGADEVADVTGAGDTVIAVFILALASGASPEEAARLSNYAGGIVVMKRGTATVTRSELRDAVCRDLPVR